MMLQAIWGLKRQDQRDWIELLQRSSGVLREQSVKSVERRAWEKRQSMD